MRKWLAPVEVAARDQRWAEERPWTVETHVFWQAQMPTLDGHDLSAKLMKKSIALLVERAHKLDTGALQIVVGRGKHSLRPGGVLGEVVQGSLGPKARDRGWGLRPHGPAAWVLITDRKRAPSSVTGGGWGGWVLALVLGGAAVVAVAHRLGWL
jgi:hypothetical protein